MVVVIVPRLPIGANPSRCLERAASLRPDLVGVGPTFQDLYAQSPGDVEGDVAVQEPRARVVGLEGDDDVAVAGHEDDVPSRGIIELQGQRARTEVFFVGLFEDGEVVAVQVQLTRLLLRS